MKMDIKRYRFLYIIYYDNFTCLIYFRIEIKVNENIKWNKKNNKVE